MDEQILSSAAIYAIRNIINGKVYVGSAVNLKRRWSLHLSYLRRGIHHGVLLQRAWAKHGASSFKLEILEHINDLDSILDREQYWIDFYDSANVGYNTCPTAGSTLGLKHSDATKKKMSDLKKALLKDPKKREELRIRAIKQASQPGARERMSEAAKKQWSDPEFRRLKREQGIAMTSSPDWKDRQSKAMKKKWQEPGVRERWCKAMTGRKSEKAIPITVFGVFYESITAAASAHGRNRDWVKRRMIPYTSKADSSKDGQMNLF